MSELIRVAIERSRVMSLLLAMILIAGAYSYIAIPKESAPDVPIPIIYVSVHNEGISPEDAVNMLVKPLETELKSVEGLDEMESSGYENGGYVLLKFQAGFDNKKALDDVRVKVDIAKSELPDDTDEPVVTEVNIATFPVLTIILSGNLPERTLKRVSEDLKDRIETVPGVLEANVFGLREEQVLYEIDRVKLESYGLTQVDIARAITDNNQLVAAGRLELDEGSYAIKVPGLFRTPQNILDIPLKTVGDQVIRVRDLGTIKPTFKDSMAITRVNGQSAVSIEVRKRIGENIILTVDEVKKVVEEEAERFPSGLTFSYTADESKNIRSMVRDLENNLLVAVVLVIAPVVLMLGLRSSLLIGVSIPGAFLLGMILLYGLGYTTNLVVLFSLILAVGMLLDGATVVVELADQRMEAGDSARDAYLYAARYMAWPVIASTATILAAFLPLMFWPGIVGEFMVYLPITLILTLIPALFMALLFVPMIGARLGRRPTVGANALGGRDSPLTRWYAKFLEGAIFRPGRVIVGTLVAFVSILVLQGVFGAGVEFFPSIEPDRAQIVVHAKGDYSIYEKDRLMRQVEARILDIPEVETFYVLAGDSGQTGQNTAQDVIGQVTLSFKDWELRARPVSEVMDDVLARTKDIYGIQVEAIEEREGPQQGKPIKLVISGPERDVIAEVTRQLRAELEKQPGLRNVVDSLPDPGIEWTMTIDRAEAAKVGASLPVVGTNIRLATTGVKLGTMRPDTSTDEIDIVARFKGENRTLSAIDDLRIGTEHGSVPVSHMVEREAKPKVTTIQRLDQKNVYYVEADVAEGVLADTVVTEIKKQLKIRELPQGVRVTFKGDDEEQREAAEFLQKAFMGALFLITLIMVMQFNSFYQTFIIMSAVILSIGGVLLGFMIIREPFGIVMGGLGIISLAGIVVQNNIVLIDTYNKLRLEYPDWRDALRETCLSRFRPVLLTALNTVTGLLPMGLNLNIDAIGREVQYNSPSTQWWDQLANAIMFGLTFTTILTLLVTPAMIALGVKMGEWWQRR
jgi:multidrug efflux pump